MITIHDDIQLDFDVTQYLESSIPNHFEPADGAWLKGVCLFHNDHNPSLHVHSEAGTFYCFSCGARGNVVRLVQRISRFPTYSDALSWLETTYGVNRDEHDGPLTLRFSERIDCGEPDYVDKSFAQQYVGVDDSYMLSRGIPVETLRQFDVGFDVQTNSVTLPWFTRHSQLLTIKHRAIGDKRFWYEPRCPALRQHLYGLHQALGQPIVYICEAEIDALTLLASGKAAVAIGGSHMSVEQARELRLAGVQTVVLACDRDKAGTDANRLIRERLKHSDIDVCDAIWPDGIDAKDCNEAGVEACRRLTYETPKMFF